LIFEFLNSKIILDRVWLKFKSQALVFQVVNSCYGQVWIISVIIFKGITANYYCPDWGCLIDFWGILNPHHRPQGRPANWNWLTIVPFFIRTSRLFRVVLYVLFESIDTFFDWLQQKKCIFFICSSLWCFIEVEGILVV